MSDPATPPHPPATTRGTETEHILQFFSTTHLREDLAAVAGPFAQLAELVASTLPRNPERNVALRKLLEAKDAAVRARLAR